MNGITIAIYLSLVFIMPIFGHTIHKRLLENPNEPPTEETNLLNVTPTTMSSNSTQILKQPESIAETSTEAPEVLVHPFVEATEVDESNESDLKTLLNDVPIDVKLVTEKPQEDKETNPSAVGEILPVDNNSSKPLQIIKENCTCFSIRQPNALENSRKFENATTSILSEVESEIGILFQIVGGNFPKVNECVGRSTNETFTKVSQAAEQNGSVTVEAKINGPPFLPYFVPVEYVLNKGMPVETILIQTESEEVDPSQLFPKLSDDFIQMEIGSIQKEENGGTAQKNDKVFDKNSIAA